MDGIFENGGGNFIEPRIAVVGVGGAGCNVVNDVFWNYSNADSIAINTDKEALSKISADKKLFICKSVTRGEGTSGDSLLGRRCAQAHLEEISSALSGHDVVYIVAGMGGGTGSGAVSIIAEIAQRLSMIVFSIVINPFRYESARLKTAKEGVARIKAVCPMTMVVENDLITERMPNLKFTDAFREVNKSIVSFIHRQQNKVMGNFMRQLQNIGELVTEQGSLPEKRPIGGLVIN